MNFKDILKLMSKSRLALVFVFMFIAGLDGVVMSQVISYVSKFDSSYNLVDVRNFVLLAFAAYLVVAFSTYMAALLRNGLKRDVNEKLKKAFIRKQLYSNSTKSDSNKLLTILSVDLKTIETKYVHFMFEVVYYSVMGIVSIFYLLYLDVKLGLIFIAFAFLPMASSLIFGKYLSSATSVWSKKNESLISSVKDMVNGLALIKTYGAEKNVEKKSGDLITEVEKSFVSVGNRGSLSTFVTAMLSWFSYIIPISISIYYVVLGELDSSVVIAMFLASDRVIYPFRTVAFYLNEIKSTKEIREKVTEELVFEEVAKPSQETFENDIDIEIKDVDFSYGEKAIFNKLSFDINFGDKILLIGKSGSGKTTLLDLLQGVVQANAGKLVYKSKGVELLSDSHRFISRINQNIFMFNESLRFNLSLGNDYADVTLLDVLKKVGLLEELGEDCLDKSYGENGEDLSGGQRQRIEIARAILQKKAVLLVDEATSALDSKNSELIRELILSLGVTVVEVAHHYNEEDVKRYTKVINLSD
ncbi:MAG: ABC transporter ATP-binding protein [Gemella sp.]|nr:ABC transporter ATP-binding protein [Gemella sp.]